jgi:four helix bundle protein
MRKKLEELPVYAKASEFSIAVTAILERPAFVRNHKHRTQISEALDSVLSNMSEGYELSSDAALANFLYISKGSAAEVVTRLKAARRRGWITEVDCRPCVAQGEEIGRMHFDEYLQLYAEDAHLHFLPPELPQGRAGARLFYEAVFDAFDGLQLTIEDMVGEGEQVGLRFSLVGRHTGVFMGFPPTGAELRVRGVTIFRFANGQCIERWSETNLLAALQLQARA